MRYFLYSHDGFGLGHTRRHLAIARALTRIDSEASVLLASGSREADRFGLPPRVELLKLPALRKVRNGHYVSRSLPIPPEDLLSLRSHLLCASIESYRPSVVLADKHPFGVCGEFRPALECARSSGARAVLGLRDILDEPAVVRREWEHQREQIPALFDVVLVYGARNVFDPVAKYEFGPAVAARTRFCGYVLNEPDDSALPEELFDETDSRPLVVATAGGGEDGFALLQTFLQASSDAPWRALVFAGPMMPDAHFSALNTSAANGQVALHRFVPNLHRLFRAADVLVCMGGYNTLVEAAAAGVPTVCVPRITPRREQAMRANAFEKLGLLRAVAPDKLTSPKLRAAIDTALTSRREKIFAEDLPLLHFDGAMQAARHLRELARLHEGTASPARAA
jgi:predicted glycosyltransferase